MKSRSFRILGVAMAGLLPACGGGNGSAVSDAPATGGGSGWIPVATVGQDLSGIWFVNASEGWVVGAGGTILHSTDGGSTWVPQTSGTSQDLSKIQFVDVRRGWIVGDGGTVLRTTDRGTTWTVNSPGTGANLVALSFISPNTGWVVGQDPNVFMTNDGGVTWVALPTDAPGAVSNHSVRFADRSSGWVLTTLPSSSSGLDVDAMLRTTDGGLSWMEQFRAEHPSDQDGFIALDLADPTTAWVSQVSGMEHANAAIWHTADGGATWTQQNNRGGGGIDALDFISATEGWGVGDFGTIIHTEDGGKSWTLQHRGLFGENPLLDVHFVDVSTGWAVRSDGMILKTTNGGKGSLWL